MDKVTISVEEYLDLLKVKKKDLIESIKERAKLIGDGCIDTIISENEILGYRCDEYLEVIEKISHYTPKFCADDIPF